MSEHGFDLPAKATRDVMDRREELADRAYEALVQAGLSAFLSSSQGGPGANVQVDPLADGGVLVEWSAQEELATAAVDLLERGVDPSALPHTIRHYETVQTCMRDAIVQILASAGFRAERAEAHTYGSAVHIRGFNL
ncbi:hypothetical protein ACIPM5_34610 [Streptomyces microflavus]|uniref:hypothetical protein n=1 Tax=Streptomyces TaxID=1883 RepID=UPI001A99E42F|nr:hypothetical protein [Streptomyces sp. CA-256286]QTA36858.1 hypothetical protein JHY03_70740 [Streptomyces sp. CA-256286]